MEMSDWIMAGGVSSLSVAASWGAMRARAAAALHEVAQIKKEHDDRLARIENEFVRIRAGIHDTRELFLTKFHEYVTIEQLDMALGKIDRIEGDIKRLLEMVAGLAAQRK